MQLKCENKKMRIVKWEKMRSQDKKLVSNYEVRVWERYLKCVRVCVCECVCVLGGVLTKVDCDKLMTCFLFFCIYLQSNEYV